MPDNLSSMQHSQPFQQRAGSPGSRKKMAGLPLMERVYSMPASFRRASRGAMSSTPADGESGARCG